MILIPVSSEPGIAYSTLPMYLGELAPQNLRGALGTMTEVFVIIGVLLAQIFSLQPILGNATGNLHRVGVRRAEFSTEPKVSHSPNRKVL